MRFKQVLLVVVALMLLATGCAGDDTAASTPSSTASTSTTTTQPTTTVATTTTTTVATTTTMPVVTDDEEKVAYISIQEFAEHLRQGDREAAAAFLGPGIGFFDIDFWECAAIVDKPEFTDCTVFKETADGSEINCLMGFGEDSWTSQVMGEQEPTYFWAAVDTDGVLTKISSPAPPGGLQAERDFREWIRATHPEDEDRMFDRAEVFRFTKESAELHMQYLDEYLAYLGSGEADSPSELLVGTWKTHHYGNIEVFNEDGTYSVGHTVDLASGDDVSQAELDFGIWSIDGNVLTRSSDPESPYCGGMEGTYEIEFLDDGDRVAVTVVSHDCDTGRGDFASGLSRYTEADS